MLKETHHQYALIPLDDVLGAVAMVHIKVDDGNALQTMALQCVARGDSHIIEKAKTHGLIVAGMVTRGTDGTERVFHLTSDDGIGRGNCRTGGAQCGIPSVHIDRGIRVKLRVGRAASIDFLAQPVGQTPKRRYMHTSVGQLDIGNRGLRSLTSVQRICDATCQKMVFNGIKPFRTLGVPGAHFVFTAVGVKKVSCCIHLRTHVSKFSVNVVQWTHNTSLNRYLSSLTRSLLAKAYKSRTVSPVCWLAATC